MARVEQAAREQRLRDELERAEEARLAAIAEAERAAEAERLRAAKAKAEEERLRAEKAEAAKRKTGSKVLAGTVLDEDSELGVAEQLRKALSQNAVRVIDLFREWDENGDGQVSKAEFRRAMPMLGLDAPKIAVDGLFDSFDPDGSGTIDMKELQRMLRNPDAGGKGKRPSAATTKMQQAGNAAVAVKRATQAVKPAGKKPALGAI
eukprot:3130038-Prymnesium_polylepis.1